MAGAHVFFDRNINKTQQMYYFLCTKYERTLIKLSGR